MSPEMLCWSVFSHSANCAAWAGCWLSLNTTVVEPPQLPLLLVVPQLGMGATRQSPLVAAALVARVFSPQTAVGQVSRVPLDRSLYHSAAKSGSTFTRCWLISCCQKLATWVEGESLMPAIQVLPEVLNHFAPACQARPANHWASLAGKAAM